MKKGPGRVSFCFLYICVGDKDMILPLYRESGRIDVLSTCVICILIKLVYILSCKILDGIMLNQFVEARVELFTI